MADDSQDDNDEINPGMAGMSEKNKYYAREERAYELGTRYPYYPRTVISSAIAVTHDADDDTVIGLIDSMQARLRGEGRFVTFAELQAEWASIQAEQRLAAKHKGDPAKVINESK